MTTDLDASLSDVGYAKVIVALKPALAVASVDAAETALARHFKIPSEAQTESLAAVARRSASKSFKREKPLDKRPVRVYPHLGLAVGFVDQGGAAGLRADAQVRAVVPAPELSLIRPHTDLAGLAAPSPDWGINRLRVPALWAAGYTGRGVLVGHLDTGFDASHPALKDALEEFAEFDMAGDKVPGAKPWDSDTINPAHGTHTAGTIAGRTVGKRVIGVAPEAKIVSGMVIEGGQVIERVLAGMDWILSKGVRLLSLSLGLRGYTPAFQVITDALRTQNVLPIFAVGNEGPNTSRSPGNYANVISVGAFAQGDTVWDDSGSQSFNRPADGYVPDLVAPGVNILSCISNRGYARWNGTSMATPHIAGLAALLLQAKPTASADELERAVFASCKRPQGMQVQRGNRGIPDAVDAFAALMGQPPMPAAVETRPRPGRRQRGVRKGTRPQRKRSDSRPAGRRGPSTRRAAARGRRKRNR
jgi:subtilisin